MVAGSISQHRHAVHDRDQFSVRELNAVHEAVQIELTDSSPKILRIFVSHNEAAVNEENRSNIDPTLTVEEYFAIARSMWKRVGEENFRKLISDFYEGVAGDEVMRPMYPEDLRPAEERLYLFIIQYFGGPTTYSEKRGHPALRVRHAPFRVDEDARKRWMRHMDRALGMNPMDEECRVFIRGYFEHTAAFLRNK